MTATRGPLRLILLAAAGEALLTGLAPHALVDHWRFGSPPLRATVGALPAMAAILTALLLLKGEGKSRSELSPLAVGFMKGHRGRRVLARLATQQVLEPRMRVALSRTAEAQGA